MVAVQPFGVDRVERILHHLQPVDRQQRAPEHADRAFGDEAVKARQQRTRLGPQVGEQQAAEFLDRVGVGLHLVAKGAVVGLVGLVQALALRAEFPAVVRAADAVLGRYSVQEGRAPVRTLFGDQPAPALAVAKQHQVFAEQAHFAGPPVVDFRGRADRLPVAAHQLAHRRRAADLRQQPVLFFAFHGLSRLALPVCPNT